MKTISISIAIKVGSLAHEEGQKNHYQIDGRTLRAYIQKAWHHTKSFTLEGLRNLLNRYEQHLIDKNDQYIATLPPHSLLCEKRCCQRAFSSYHRFLKKELVWGRDGHIKLEV